MMIPIARASLLLLVGLLAAGCAHKGPASIAGGECKIFERPPYEVRGQKPYDQDWINSNIEAGGGGCGWEPPQPRPPEIDAVPTRPAAVTAPAKKRPGVIRRVKSRAEAAFTRRRAPVPALPAAESLVLPGSTPAAAAPIAAAPPEPEPVPAPPPPRRSLVDQLLHPE